MRSEMPGVLPKCAPVDSRAEVEVIARARAGDRHAFDDLWSRYQKALVGYVSVRIDSGDEAEPLVNEAAFLVWQKIGLYRDEYTFYTFARYWTGIALLRYRRRQGRWTDRHILFGDVSADIPLALLTTTGGLVSLSGETGLDAGIPSDEYAAMLKSALTHGGQPHQVICFVYCRLLEGWSPRKVVSRLSDVRLCEVERYLEQSYLDESGLPVAVVSDCFGPLRIAVTGSYGLTSLRDYYGSDPEANVSDWVYKVRVKTRRFIAREKL